MTETPLQRIRVHLVRLWRARRESLRHSLTVHPQSLMASHWSIRVRIYTYLLARYGDHDDLEYYPPRRIAHVFHPPEPSREYGTLPRSRTELREILDRIAELNAELQVEQHGKSSQIREQLLTAHDRNNYN